MNILFLGTSSMLPTKERNPSSILLTYKNENILIDCGEGTQKQLRIKNISPAKITKLLITHWHGDHVLGIPGLLQSLGAGHYTKTLEIYGPKGTKNYFANMLRSFIFPIRIKMNINEINSGKFFENNDFELHSSPMKHNAPCLAYSFTEKSKRKINLEYTKKFGLTKHPLLGKLQKGKSIVYNGKKIEVNKATKLVPGKKVAIVLDTEFNENAVKFAKSSDLLIAESTYLNEEHKKNEEYKHMTIKDAINLAKKAKAKQLALTHFSQRYKDLKDFEKEAKKQFKNVILARDFSEIEL